MLKNDCWPGGKNDFVIRASGFFCHQGLVIRYFDADCLSWGHRITFSVFRLAR
jgi:hypothetical protein